MELGVPLETPSTFLVTFPTMLWFLGSSSNQPLCPSGERVWRCWLLASRCLLPWLGRDSSHPRFLPQRARGTDPVLVLEGRWVSQTLRSVCVGRDGELGGCGFVVTMWRKVPSCMALLCPVRSCREAAATREEGGAAV